MKIALLAAVTASLSNVAQAEPLTCHWANKQQCDPNSACRPSVNKVWATVDATAKRYQRCDSKGCDSYDAEVSASGVYTTFDLPGRGVFMKIGPEGAATEVVSLGNSVLVSQGTCRPTPSN